MDGENKFGAGQVIVIGVTMALLLLWMDGWSHSVPVMVVTAFVALIVFLGFRNKKPSRKLTYSEQVMLERQSAHRWMASQHAAEEEERTAKPKLTLIEGGKEAPSSDTVDEVESA